MGAFLAAGNYTWQDGQVSTTGATTGTLLAYTLLAVPCTAFIKVWVAGFESTGPSAFGEEMQYTVRTTGTVATLVGNPVDQTQSDAAISTATAQVSVSGNVVTVSATGIALLTIDWTCAAFIIYAQ